MDGEKNMDPDYRKNYSRPPVTYENTVAGTAKWITYGNPYMSAKEITVAPMQTWTLREPLAFGCIVVQGRGKLGHYPAEAPTLLRFGQPSCDEFFVGYEAAQRGVEFVNAGLTEPLVILMHFGPHHPTMPPAPV